jgi:hypothetical protein
MEEKRRRRRCCSRERRGSLGRRTNESMTVQEIHRAERWQLYIQTHHLPSSLAHFGYQSRDTKVNSVPLGLPKYANPLNRKTSTST